MSSSSTRQQQVQEFGCAIADYLFIHRSKLDGFHWDIKPACVEKAKQQQLLTSMSVKGGFAETMQLRRDVAERARDIYKRGQDSERQTRLADLAQFVIVDWGGLKSNKRETIEEYAMRFTGSDLEYSFEEIQCAEDLRAAVPSARRRGLFSFAGIASWSKWLNFVWNDWALIYDARIAFALDAIHFIRNVNAPVFPVPVGRSPKLANFDAQGTAAFGWLANHANGDFSASGIGARLKDAMMPERKTYCYYLEVMAAAHHSLWPSPETTPLVHTEMLLFKLSIENVADDFARELLTRLTPPARTLQEADRTTETVP
ncbi:MAG TPA: hypothetical protein VJU59_35840 [Paraburkholderia sp.]|uniref:hypothetical protein n=1 Tax=Paraburkholderia sp. TaxID=1926495 RepID=UPI002B497FBF|nr:hypothetical protein [Paraburkholderia sp.]HKR44983.1 hypothetical protein [Paraburkholderia sp.]